MPADQMMISNAWQSAGRAAELLMRAATAAELKEPGVEDNLDEARQCLRQALKELGPE